MLNLKFLLDENISQRVFTLMRKRKFNVQSIHSLNIDGMKNGVLLNQALENDRILITFDQDFLQPSNPNHCGIIVLQIYPALDSVVLPILTQFFQSLEEKSYNWKGKIAVLTTTEFHFIN